MLTAVTQLALASYSQDKDRIESGHERVQRDIAMRTPPDHQFALAAVDRAADERAMGQDLECL